MSRRHFSDYDQDTTERCERALLTLLGDIGPWRERIYLAGGLAPRYLAGTLPEGARAHVGTTDVDIIIGLALADEAPETYRTLQNNLEKALFNQQEPSFRWARDVDGVTVLVEFLCETDQVEPGRIFRPKGEYTGSKLGAFNVRGAQLARHDYIEHQIRGERLDDGGQSVVILRVTNVLPYTVLKIFAFQDRHENKDAYDLVFTLLNHVSGPRAAGTAAAASPVARHPQVSEALTLLGERFADIAQDGPAAYAAFLGDQGGSWSMSSGPTVRGRWFGLIAASSLGDAARSGCVEVGRRRGCGGPSGPIVFGIQPHTRLDEWVADEAGLFRYECLEYGRGGRHAATSRMLVRSQGAPS